MRLNWATAENKFSVTNHYKTNMNAVDLLLEIISTATSCKFFVCAGNIVEKNIDSIDSWMGQTDSLKIHASNR